MAGRRHPFIFILGMVFLVVSLLFFLSPFLLDFMGRHLIVQDKLEKADVILVLAGDGNGERVSQGVELYRKKYSNRLLMSGGPLAWKLKHAQWMKKQAMEEGVPSQAILMQGRSRSTIEDARFSLPIVKQHGFKSLILVTSPTHTRRAAKVFHKFFDKEGIKVIVYPVQKSEFNPDRWWTRHEDTGLVVWEYVSSVLYFFKGY